MRTVLRLMAAQCRHEPERERERESVYTVSVCGGSCGAAVSRKNDKGETAFDLAIKNAHDDVAKKLTTFMSQSTLNRMSQPRTSSPGLPDDLQWLSVHFSAVNYRVNGKSLCGDHVDRFQWIGCVKKSAVVNLLCSSVFFLLLIRTHYTNIFRQKMNGRFMAVDFFDAP